MPFYKNKYFILTVLVQLLGPYLFSFDKWANIIQYFSAFGMTYAIHDYLVHHKPQIKQLVAHMKHQQQKEADHGQKNSP
jgi:hypothetical protein